MVVMGFELACPLFELTIAEHLNSSMISAFRTNQPLEMRRGEVPLGSHSLNLVCSAWLILVSHNPVQPDAAIYLSI